MLVVGMRRDCYGNGDVIGLQCAEMSIVSMIVSIKADFIVGWISSEKRLDERTDIQNRQRDRQIEMVYPLGNFSYGNTLRQQV